MRIKEIDIEGFGIFQQVTIPDIASNEAGKTTLMAYIRAVLFGFELRRGGNNRYEPVRGGAHGGALVVETAPGKRFRIERVDKGGKGRVKVGAMFPFHVSESEKTRSDEAVLRQLVHGTSKLMYQNVFAFGIGELERLDTLQADEISQHIYTVGMGAGLNSLAAVQSLLETEQGQLFKASWSGFRKNSPGWPLPVRRPVPRSRSGKRHYGSGSTFSINRTSRNNKARTSKPKPRPCRLFPDLSEFFSDDHFNHGWDCRRWPAVMVAT